MLEHLAQPAFDLVVLDWMIPKEDGRDNFHKFRQIRPDLPILLCTGMVQTDQAAELLCEEAVDLLRKPFRMNDLWYAVNKAMGCDEHG